MKIAEIFGWRTVPPPPPQEQPYPELHAAIVNLTSGTSFKCVVWRHSGPYVVLRNVEILQDRGKTVQRGMDGEVLVKQSDIDFIQVLG